MSIAETIIYGLASGFTEFLPVSSQGHQALLLQLFGRPVRDPVLDLCVHCSVFLAVVIACRPLLVRMRREQTLAVCRRRRSQPDRRGPYELRLIKSAAVPLVIGLLLYCITIRFESQPIFLAAFFLLNGIFLLVADYSRQGNKDARWMTGLDGILLGVIGALSALPGISRIGTMRTYALSRGADRQAVSNWVLILSIPALVTFLGIDVYHLFTIPVSGITWISAVGYLLAACGAYLGSYLSILLMRFLSVHTGFSGFSYYSIGTAIFSFILYLIA